MTTNRPRSSRPIVRTAATILLLLLCGAVFQSMLAWSCLLISQSGVPSVTTRTAAQIAKPLDVPQIVNADGSTSGPPIAELDQHRGLGWYTDVENARAKTPAGRRCWGEFAWVRCGWPMHSFELHWERIADDGTWPDWRPDPGGSEGWCEIGAGPTPAGVVVPLFPWRPIWSGTIMNTLVFAGIFALMAALVRRAVHGAWTDRAARRRHEGLCERCAYPLLGLKICPECGLAAGDEGGPSPPSPLP